jgi:uncharacterized protein
MRGLKGVTRENNMTDQSNEPKPNKPRGFAAMDRALVAEIARKGGIAAHRAGTAHQFTSDEGRAAGAKGGRATSVRRQAARQRAATNGGGQ